MDSAIAYVNATGLYGDKVDKLEKSALASLDKYSTSNNRQVGAGYRAISNATASTILSSPIGLIELVFMNSDGNGDIGINIALQHPYSHGRIAINSSDPMDYPSIDPNYLSNPIDLQILRDGSKLARAIGKTGPLKDSLTGETSPGSGKVASDDDDDAWNDWLKQTVDTEFHPSSTCAMLPIELGGVVDPNLRVYGLANVRVADASVPPIALSTHLMASTYGVAEQASSIIRDFYNNLQLSSTGPNFSTNSTSSSSNSTAVPHPGGSNSTVHSSGPKSTSTSTSKSDSTSTNSATATADHPHVGKSAATRFVVRNGVADVLLVSVFAFVFESCLNF